MQNATQFERNLFFNYILLSTNGISPFFALCFGKQYISLHGTRAVAPFISDQCLEARRRCPEGLLVSLSFLFALSLPSLLQTCSHWALQKCPSEEMIQLNPNCQDMPQSSTTARRSQSCLQGSHKTSAFKQATGRCWPSNLYPRLFSACYLPWACARPWPPPMGLPNARSMYDGV